MHTYSAKMFYTARRDATCTLEHTHNAQALTGGSIIHSVASIMDAHLFASVCVHVCFCRAHSAFISPPSDSAQGSPRVYSSDMLCETQQIRDRQP